MHSLLFVLAALTPVTSFGPNPGALAAYDYVPDGLPDGAPLVVVLHGCTQTAAAMADSAGWNALADTYKFAVLYPEQQTANNPVRCFNWAGDYGNPADFTRGMGENASILAMVDDQIARHEVDPKRVFVVGLSAGGAFTSVMLATYPERFAGGSVMAGVPYHCATDVNGAYRCTNPGVAHTAEEWGGFVRAAAPAPSGARARVQIWHGTSDTTVAAMNGDELVKQWTDVHGTDATADATDTLGKATRTRYEAGGKTVVEYYKISGMAHGVAVGGTGCPAKTAAFFLDVGVCSTLVAAQFFGLVPSDPNDPGNPGTPDGGVDPDPDSDKDGGGFGCSASHGGGLGLVFAALALLRRRRPTAL